MVDGSMAKLQPSAIFSPIRFRSSQTCPHQGYSRRPTDQAQPINPPRFGASAQLEPGGRRGERHADDDRQRTAAHVALDRGAPVDVEAPFGSFTFPSEPAERRFVFIAGGTGIAPLRAMLRHALAIPHREVGLVYSARTPDDFAYEQELRALAREGRIELRQTITRTGGDAAWAGGRGRIGRAELEPLVHDPATLCFVCGPQTLVDGTTKLAQELGVPRARLRVEEWPATSP